MTPGARVAAAIEILDDIADGRPAEQALTRWARSSRFAGSKDRAAVRDHVFDALRHWNSDVVRGGGTTGRARMIGRLRAAEQDADTLFHGQGHAPAPLTAEERASGTEPEDTPDLWDLPAWLIDRWRDSLSGDAARTALALTERAPVTLRVNTTKTDRETAQAALRGLGIETIPNARADSALTVTSGARQVRLSAPYLDGLVEIQDASSQAAVRALPGQGRALDFCAGGGGKSLALAAQGWSVTAHDIDPRRMQDLPLRAERGGHTIETCAPDAVADAGPFDLVLCDAPCSGSGTWRRTPDAKWALTPERLDELHKMQADVLETAHSLVAPSGTLAYATCSVLSSENASQIEAFLARHPDWVTTRAQSWTVDAEGDGFFLACLTRA
ncbi:RsmB/NOP family class I SAM-dependent RNA methyltransferase [uncultured Tateyamaria sp.]|uniref:RsmB/NOP family class I SAM-dependent RNA methyltransferase n=1 Tax=uncultured Tateyamaria sp. TaxID=455651 RepID=UPI0026213D50|nr:RsmB/NOP family class I SAM-dependent RNA methyltransferase [uncultured Tateyamaria sp.]